MQSAKTSSVELSLCPGSCRPGRVVTDRTGPLVASEANSRMTTHKLEIPRAVVSTRRAKGVKRLLLQSSSGEDGVLAVIEADPTACSCLHAAVNQFQTKD
jgi:hypothetical protein